MEMVNSNLVGKKRFTYDTSRLGSVHFISASTVMLVRDKGSNGNKSDGLKKVGDEVQNPKMIKT